MELILTIGISCSGKSHWSKVYSKQNGIVRLSSDELRALYGDGEGDQTVNHKVFDCLYQITKHLLVQGHSVLIDATSYNKRNRKIFLRIGKDYLTPVTAAVFRTPYEVCVSRNQNRERKVPENILFSQYKNWQEPSLEEGFSYISYIYPQDDFF